MAGAEFKITDQIDEKIFQKLEKLSEQTGIKFTLTLSLAEEDACDCIKKYL